MLAKEQKAGIDAIMQFQWGAHICLFYETVDDLYEVLFPYFRNGLESNEHCVWITPESVGVQNAQAAMRRSMPDLGPVLNEHVEFFSFKEWYIHNGIIDPEVILDKWADKEKIALEKGSKGIRIAGVVDGLDEVDFNSFSRYEGQVQCSIGGLRMIGLCCYPMQSCSPARLLDIMSSHDYALIKESGEWKIFENSCALMARNKLEKKIAERTRELLKLNEALQSEINKKQTIEDSLKESENRLKALIETTSDWVWEVDVNCVYTYVSSKVKDILGYDPREVLGKTPFDFMPPEEAEKMQSELSMIIARKEPFSFLENRNVHKNGSIVVLETNGIPILDSMGNLQGYRGIDRDITLKKAQQEEKEKIQNQLMQSQKMEAIGMLSGGIAHDFNNLMVIIKLNSDLALEKASVEAKSYLQQIKMASERAESLTKQLLIFSKRQPTKTQALSLNQLIGDTLVLLKRVIGENIQIKTELAPGIRSIQADKGNVEQILMNLVINARDAMPKGGLIRIKTENLDQSISPSGIKTEAKASYYVRLSIQDTGVGMDEETLGRIFDPFFTTKGHLGTGLGLAVVSNIIKDLDGWIDIKTKHGEGTRFELYMPAIDQAEQMANMELDLGASRGNGERILLVEDEKYLMKSISLVLSRNGYSVFEALSAEEAAVICEKEDGRFDMVLTDMILRNENGLDLIEKLKIPKKIKVLITSGYLDVETQWPTITSKGYGFLQKPYEPQDLLRSISAMLRNRHPKQREKNCQ